MRARAAPCREEGLEVLAHDDVERGIVGLAPDAGDAMAGEARGATGASTGALVSKRPDETTPLAWSF
jgi:hypothetical protein